MGQLDGKVAVITGGGSGIGKAIAEAFAGEGCNIVITGRGQERLNTAAEDIRKKGTKVLAVPADVSKEDQVVALFEKVMAEFRRVDLLVNNAGTTAGSPLEEITGELWEMVVGVNLSGVFYCTREAFKIMKQAGGGRIINIGSISSNVPRQNAAPYSATKHGVTGLTKSTALEGREFGISCGQLNPGNTRVEWFEEAIKSGNHPSLTASEPLVAREDMARAALYMATLPPEANVLEMTVLPVAQPYIGRG